MPVHDWTKVEAGVFHAVHHGWIEDIARALNGGLLPPEFYALPEHRGGGFGPDVLTLFDAERKDEQPPTGARASHAVSDADGGVVVLDRPRVTATGEIDLEYYRKKQNTVVVRYVSDDRMVAVVEVVSRGNKSSRVAMEELLKKVGELLAHGIHVMVLDLFPPTPRDPNGIHAAILAFLNNMHFTSPPDKPLTLAAYESDLGVRWYVEPVAVGHTMIDMPLFLHPGAHVPLPLEETYMRAYRAQPARTRGLVEA